jgi:NAD(P)-dependent dehydrogenase (short-subunit alcohol dehydrogenase family)
LNLFDLENKTIVITGASSGIGRQCAVTCATFGANVILIGRSLERLEDTAKNCPSKTFIVNHDITDYTSLELKLRDLIKITGRIDGVIHAAGISTTLPLKNIHPNKMEPFIATNVYAAVNLTRVLTKVGFYNTEACSIVFIASVMGLVGEMGKTIYSLTKGALIAASKSMALELASKQIRVNCIAPGVVVTPMSQNAVYAQHSEALERVKQQHPLGLGHPEDIAAACVYLLAPASKWVTGTTLVVDGGYTAK